VTAKGMFQLMSFDEGGVQGPSANKRLVCVMEDGGKLAIWGEELPHRNMRNIDSVLKAGVPCTVECNYRAPAEEMRLKYGHTHWVAQDDLLRIISGHPT
jgi:hypothetical protein